MNDEITVNERPKKPWTRFEYIEKKKEIVRDLADVINRHGFDAHFEIPDFMLADIAVSTMFDFSRFKHKVERWEFGQVIKNHEQWDGNEHLPYGCDQEYPDDTEEDHIKETYPPCTYPVQDREQCSGYSEVGQGCKYRSFDGKGHQCHSVDRWKIFERKERTPYEKASKKKEP